MEGFRTPQRLTEWLAKMGYEGKVPTNLKPFCNPSTALIWEQLIQIVKPKQEIQHIRNNILINRLSRNDETCSNPGIHLFKHGSEYPIKEIETWNRKQKLEKQIAAVQEGVNEAEAKLTTLSNGNKIKYLNLENVRHKIRQNQEHAFLLNAKSAKLEAEKANVEEMLALARNLTPIESEDQNKTEVLETLKKCCDKLQKLMEKQDEAQPAPPVTKTNSANNFKTPQKKFIRRVFTSLKKKANVFTSTKISYQNKKKTKGLDDSLGLLEDLSMTFEDALAASSFKDLNFSNNMCYDLVVLNDQDLNDLIDTVLHKYDRLAVWNTLLNLNEISKAQLFDAIIVNGGNHNSITTVDKKDQVLTQLYATHVDYELKTMRIDLNINELQRELSKLQDTVFTTLAENTGQDRVSELKDRLGLQQKEAGLIAAAQLLHKIVRNMRESTSNQEDLRMIREKAHSLEENIVLKLSSIEHKLSVFKQIYDLMSEARNETCMLVRKLAQFTVDATWTAPLSASTSSIEIGTFLEFPLEYNRVLNTGGTKVYFRDLPINYVPYQEDFDSNSVHILATLLQNPYNSAETLLLNIVKAKLKMDQLKGLKYVPGSFESSGYSLEQLQSQESYIAYALEKLKSLIYRASNSKVMHVVTQVREITTLWLEMPMKDFVCSKRLFNGASYSHYEKQFEKFYTQL